MCPVGSDGTVGDAFLQWNGVVGKFQLSTCQRENSLSHISILCAMCKEKEGSGWERREGSEL